MKIIRLQLFAYGPFAFVRGEMTSSTKLWRTLERGYNFTLRTHETFCGYFCYVTTFYFYRHDCRVGKNASILWNQTLLHKPLFFKTLNLTSTQGSFLKKVIATLQNLLTIFFIQEHLIAVWLTSLTVTCKQHRDGLRQQNVPSFKKFPKKHIFPPAIWLFLQGRNVWKSAIDKTLFFNSFSCFNLRSWFELSWENWKKKKTEIISNNA